MLLLHFLRKKVYLVVVWNLGSSSLCTVTNLKTVDIIRLNPHQETTYEVNVNTGAPIQADDRRFKRAIGYIAEQIGIKLSDASRSYPRS